MEQEIQVIEENTEQEISIIEEPILTGSGEIEITENGIYNVGSYASANVQVPQPSGTINITENGITDVTNYASANVNVPQPSGTIEITQNGTVDVTNYETANVNIESDPSEYFKLDTTNNARGIKDFIKKIPDLDAGTSTSMDNSFSSMPNLEEVGIITALSCSNFSYGFYNDEKLTKIKGIKTTSSLKNISNMFRNSSSLIEAPLFDTSGVTSVQSMFYGCTQLTKVPEFDFSSITNITYMSGMFQSANKLTDESLNNILKSCISAGATGTLYSLGFVRTIYSAKRIQALPSYQDFINAGWTIGY